MKLKEKPKSYRFESDIWFTALVEAEDYESAKKRYNKLLRSIIEKNLKRYKMKLKEKLKNYRFESDTWFTVLVEAEDYDRAKLRYNKLLRKKEHRI